MTSTAQSKAINRTEYSHGKQWAQQIFHETMAAIDVRHAMLAKLKFEGDALTAGDITHPLVRPPRVVAFGKAANRMAPVLDEILADALKRESPWGPPNHPSDWRISSISSAAIPTRTPAV